MLIEKSLNKDLENYISNIYMRVCHFILGKANKNRANGVNQVIAGLAKYTVHKGAKVRVIGLTKNNEFEGQLVERDGFFVETYSKWARPMKIALQEAISWADIVHLHGVYSPWNILVARICEKLNCPYVVTLHDGLAPERVNLKNIFKKKLFDLLFQRKYLKNASFIHVLTPEEATDLIKFIDPKRIIYIPNGVDLEDYPSLLIKTKAKTKRLVIGYLGRLSSEKNLESLCKAFARINTNIDLKLKLAGPRSEQVVSLLQRFAKYGVEWVGPKFGYDKSDFIASVDLFVHPSLCDVFSIAAMEVLAIGTPLLITRTSKASYFYCNNAFFMCEPTVFGLEQGLQNALNHQNDWPTIAANGRRLIEERLNWGSSANDMLEAYHLIVLGE